MSASVTEDPLGRGRIEPRELEQEMRSSYLAYAMTVIVGRALPDVRDGLKPVHRRVLWGMHEGGHQPNRPYVKSARVVGDVMGKYHPHGNQPIYDALARMAQPFSLRYPLVDGQGNFGSIDDDPPAAERYTECRLQRLATEMLRDIDMDTVDFAPNYDESRKEPVVVPARFPNLLVNGSTGIAVGMATNIPPHHLGETVDAVVQLIDKPDANVEDLMKHVKGPDFPTGAIVVGRSGIRDAYRSGRGRIVMRARAHIEELRGGKSAIVVTELPYGVKKGGDTGVIKKIADLVNEKVITEVSDLADHSDKSGMRIQIELKRDAIPQVALNKLFKHTGLQTTFGYNAVALVDGVPRTLSLLELVRHYLDYQREIVTRRSKYELRQAEKRAHILQGYLIALDNLDAVIALIRGSDDTDSARTGLMEPFELSEKQAQAILDLRLARLTGLARKEIEEEYADLQERIAELRGILGDPARIDGLIREELLEVKGIYGKSDDRRTEIVAGEDALELEDMIAEEDMVIAITRSGYIKRLPVTTLPRAAPRRDRRDGHGHEGRGLHRAPLRRLDARLHPLLHDRRQGLPAQGARAAARLAPVEGPRDRQPAAVPPGRADPRRDRDARLQGVEVPRLRDEEGHRQEDGVPRVQHAAQGGRDHRAARCARTTSSSACGSRTARTTSSWSRVSARRCGSHEKDVRSMGRPASGVAGMKLRGDDEVIEVDIASDDADLLVVTENGWGKRTRVAEYPVKGRGTMGVKTVAARRGEGTLAGARIVRDGYQVMLISDGGTVIRMAVDGIKRSGRSTQGVIVMRLREGEQVSSLAPVVGARRRATPSRRESVPEGD